MNSTQIEYCLKKICGTNDVMNTWIDLANLSCIYLDQDANIYPDKKHVMFYFDTTNNLLQIKTGKLQSGNFIFDQEEPNHLVSFDVIAGFIQNSKVTDVGQFEYMI